jgi:hypothetical protein
MISAPLKVIYDSFITIVILSSGGVEGRFFKEVKTSVWFHWGCWLGRTLFITQCFWELSMLSII